MPQKDSAEKAVRDIRRKTRREFSAEEKIRIVLEGLRGRATLIRYCDDFIVGFEQEDDARRVMEVLGKRLGRF